MKLLAACLICLAFGAISFAQTKCFENSGLKESTKVDLTITGGKVSSWYKENAYDEENGKGYEFTGTRTGSTVTITKFTDNKKPAWMPKGKNWIWTLVPAAGGKEILRMNIYGQNYDTKKYSVYPVDFASCMSSLMTRDDTKRVSFAKGAASAKVAVTGSDKQAFLINIRKGQFIGAVAFGYNVEIYYPNGDVYAFAEEPGAIKNQTSNLDFNSSEAAPTSGDVLILLEKAPEGTGSATFFVKNTAKELETAMNAAIENR